MKYSEELWLKNKSIFDAIFTHPFIIELADGTLSSERFNFYIEQDAFYLINYAQTLIYIAERSPSLKLKNCFQACSQETLVLEKELYKLCSALSDSDKIELTPTCLAYSNYILAMATTASLEEAIAAIIPCLWIYRDIGKFISERSTENNPYHSWIQINSSPEQEQSANNAIAMLDEVIENSSFAIKLRVQAAFKTSCIYEWHFWNDAYNQSLFSNSIREEANFSL